MTVYLANIHRNYPQYIPTPTYFQYVQMWLLSLQATELLIDSKQVLMHNSVPRK